MAERMNPNAFVDVKKQAVISHIHSTIRCCYFAPSRTDATVQSPLAAATGRTGSATYQRYRKFLTGFHRMAGVAKTISGVRSRLSSLSPRTALYDTDRDA